MHNKSDQHDCGRAVLTVRCPAPSSWLQNGLWLLGPCPLVFLFSPAWKQNKSEAGGTQNGIGTLHIVPRASSSTFLGWLGSGPPVQEYCSNSTAPQTWPQQTTAAFTDHCGVQAEWWLSLPHQSSLFLSLSPRILTRICCLSLSASLLRPQSSTNVPPCNFKEIFSFSLVSDRF